MKRYYSILVLTAILAIQQPVVAQQKKTTAGSGQKAAGAINTATWKEVDLGAYTFERRIPLTVKLPASVKLKKETEAGYYYYMELNKRLTFNVLKVFNESVTVAESMAETKKTVAKFKQYGMSYKLLIDEPEVFLVAVNIKKTGVRFHLLVVHISDPEGGVHYRFANVASDLPDTYSDAEWMQMARSLKASIIK